MAWLSGCALMPTSETGVSLGAGAIDLSTPQGFCVHEDAVSDTANSSFAFFTDCGKPAQAAVSVSLLRHKGEGILDEGMIGEKVARNLYRARHRGAPMPFTKSKKIYRTGVNAGGYAALITYYSVTEDEKTAQEALWVFSRAVKRSVR